MKESEKEMGGGGGGKKWRRLQRKWKKGGRRNFKCLPPLSPSVGGTIFQKTPVVLAKPAHPQSNSLVLLSSYVGCVLGEGVVLYFLSR